MLRGLARTDVAKIQTIIDGTNFLAEKTTQKVDFFEIFNNVKPSLEIIHWQPNKVVIKVKVLSL